MPAASAQGSPCQRARDPRRPSQCWVGGLLWGEGPISTLGVTWAPTQQCLGAGPHTRSPDTARLRSHPSVQGIGTLSRGWEGKEHDADIPAPISSLFPPRHLPPEIISSLLSSQALNSDQQILGRLPNYAQKEPGVSPLHPEHLCPFNRRRN